MSEADDQSPARDFGAFYQATLAPLRRYLGRLLGNNHDAQDLAHDAYSRVYRKMAEETVHQPQGLLFTTARNLAINQIRRREHAPLQPDGDNIIALTPSAAPGIARVVMARQEWEATAAAIERLPLGCRAVFLLCRFEGLTHPEVALRLGISRKTVEKQHARALRLLRASLQKDEILPEAARRSDAAANH